MENQTYLVEVEQIEKLRVIADSLQAGNDYERDIGHKLWLIINQIESQKSV